MPVADVQGPTQPVAIPGRSITASPETTPLLSGDDYLMMRDLRSSKRAKAASRALPAPERPAPKVPQKPTASFLEPLSPTPAAPQMHRALTPERPASPAPDKLYASSTAGAPPIPERKRSSVSSASSRDVDALPALQRQWSSSGKRATPVFELQMPLAPIQDVPAPPPPSAVALFCDRWKLTLVDGVSVRQALNKVSQERRKLLIAACDRLGTRLGGGRNIAMVLDVLISVPTTELGGFVARVVEVFARMDRDETTRLRAMARLCTMWPAELAAAVEVARLGLLTGSSSELGLKVVETLALMTAAEIEAFAQICSAVKTGDLGGPEAMRTLLFTPAAKRVDVLAGMQRKTDLRRAMLEGAGIVTSKVNLSIEPHIVLHRLSAFINGAHPPSTQATIDVRLDDGRTLRQRANRASRVLHLAARNLRALEGDVASQVWTFSQAWYAAEGHPQAYEVRLHLLMVLASLPEQDMEDLRKPVLLVMHAAFPDFGLGNVAEVLAG